MPVKYIDTNVHGIARDMNSKGLVSNDKQGLNRALASRKQVEKTEVLGEQINKINIELQEIKELLMEMRNGNTYGPLRN